jgi:hypothetical protein
MRPEKLYLTDIVEAAQFIVHDQQGNTLTVWFGSPQDEFVAEETGDEVISKASNVQTSEVSKTSEVLFYKCPCAPSTRGCPPLSSLAWTSKPTILVPRFSARPNPPASAEQASLPPQAAARDRARPSSRQSRIRHSLYIAPNPPLPAIRPSKAR